MNIAFVFEQFGPYHIDRCNAAARELGGNYKVVGIELSEQNPNHLWDRPPAPTEFELVPLSTKFDSSRMRMFFLLITKLWALRPAVCFLCHYERPEIFLTALVLRILR